MRTEIITAVKMLMVFFSGRYALKTEAVWSPETYLLTSSHGVKTQNADIHKNRIYESSSMSCSLTALYSHSKYKKSLERKKNIQFNTSTETSTE
jgi:hypothetical protein